MTSPRRGQVVRVRLDPVVGSEQGGERPSLVVSADFINRTSPVIIVIPLTSRRTERAYPFEALIEPPEGGLPMRSRALVLHMRGVDRTRIVGAYGDVSAETMARVEDALRIATGLEWL